MKEGLFCVYKLVVLEDDAVAAEAAVCAVAASPFADRFSVSTALNADALEKMLGGGLIVMYFWSIFASMTVSLQEILVGA